MAALLPPVHPTDVGLRPEQLDRACSIIERHIAENRYPGAQLAVARHGKLALLRTFGKASVSENRPATDSTLWRLYSSTKVLIAAGVWLLVERGQITFQDRVADHIPEFARHGKGDVTILQLLSHQGGFPSALNPIDRRAWDDHALLRRLVCDIALEWAPGSRVHYHQRSAHWAAAVLIEALSDMDYREFIRTQVLEPLGLDHDLHVGLPEQQASRAADVHSLGADSRTHVFDDEENSAAYRAAGVPGTGAYGTASGMAAFYQMMLGGGALNGARLFSPRTIQYVTRNYTADRVDAHMKMPMHRGIGPHSRGTTESIRGLGSLASPRTYGHGGVGTSYCWADPESGTSFAYVSNSRLPDPWHSWRLDILSNCIHTAIGDL